MLKTTTPRVTRTTGATSRFYDITHADGTAARYPSVTTILSAISKPALIGWAAKEERLAVSEAAADLYADAAAQRYQMPRATYLLALEQRLGKTKAHLKTLAKAAEIGTAVHHKIEWALKRQMGQIVGPEPQLADAGEWAFMAWQDFARDVSLTPVHVEQVVWSRKHGYAGTLDHVVRLNARALLTTLDRQGPVESSVAEWLAARETALACVDIKTGKSIYGEAMLQSAAYQHAYMEMGHGIVDGGLIVRLPKVTSDPGFEVAVVPPARQLFPTFLATRQLWEWQYAEETAYRARRSAVA